VAIPNGIAFRKDSMDPRIKELWIAALESGEYKQGRGVLRDGDAFCCLGVLCDLHRKETGGGEWLSKNEFDCLQLAIIPSSATTYVSSVPSNSLWPVQSWAGLKSRDPSVAGSSLSYLNDNGSSFKEIAEIIRREL
jgi:hypothetical protein